MTGNFRPKSIDSTRIFAPTKPLPVHQELPAHPMDPDLAPPEVSPHTTGHPQQAAKHNLWPSTHLHFPPVSASATPSTPKYIRAWIYPQHMTANTSVWTVGKNDRHTREKYHYKHWWLWEHVYGSSRKHMHGQTDTYEYKKWCSLSHTHRCFYWEHGHARKHVLGYFYQKYGRERRNGRFHMKRGSYMEECVLTTST